MLPITHRLLAALAGQPPAVWAAYPALGELVSDDPTAAAVFAWMAKFISASGELPTPSTFTEQTGIPITAGDQPHALYGMCEQAYIRRKLVLLSEEVQPLVTADPQAALAKITAATQMLNSRLERLTVYDFSRPMVYAWPWFKEKWLSPKTGVSLPWPSFARMSGSIHGGEIVSLVGRPGLGKSWLMIHMAMHIWRQGHPVVFFAMEMMGRKMMERLTAHLLKIPIDAFKSGYSEEFAMQNAVKGMVKQGVKSKVYEDFQVLESEQLPPFIVVDANLASKVSDVVALTRRYSPSAVFGDGAYLFEDDTKRYRSEPERIGMNCRAFKRDVATALDVPVFLSWQFNRESTKLKEGVDPGLEHIAGGDAIGQLSSVAYGLTDPDAKADGDVSKIRRRKIRLLKGRDGETGEITIRWDFAKMDFSEDDGLGGVPTFYGV